MIVQILDPDRREAVSRAILEALPDWFGVQESIERYVASSRNQPFFAAMEGDSPVGFLCLKETGSATMELCVMGVLKEYHRRGIGRQLFEAARAEARVRGYSFLQVKTVQMGRYPDYDDTNRFYLSLGFQEFEVFPALWDEANPCQVYVMSLV